MMRRILNAQYSREIEFAQSVQLTGGAWLGEWADKMQNCHVNPSFNVPV
jgi:hypothetical protein